MRAVVRMSSKKETLLAVFAPQTIDSIGSLEANTSLVVPVKAWPRSRAKRFAGLRCLLYLLYDYDCGGTRTRSEGITLFGGGRQPRPCTGGGVIFGRT